MSFGRKSIDFGPIALQVGETSEIRLPMLNSGQISEGSMRLKNILSRSVDMQETEAENEEALNPQAENIEAQRCNLGMTELTAELAYLWVNNGSSGPREVRLGLAPDLIPNTSVRILDQGGELHVQLSVSSDAARQWLDAASEKLAQDLGQRLHRSVCILVNRSADGQSGSSACQWKCD